MESHAESAGEGLPKSTIAKLPLSRLAGVDHSESTVVKEPLSCQAGVGRPESTVAKLPLSRQARVDHLQSTAGKEPLSLQSSVGHPESTVAKHPLSRQVDGVGHPKSTLVKVSLVQTPIRQPSIRPVASGTIGGCKPLNVQSLSLRPVPASAVPRCVNVIRLNAAPILTPGTVFPTTNSQSSGTGAPAHFTNFIRPVVPMQNRPATPMQIRSVAPMHIRPVAPMHIRGARYSTASSQIGNPVPVPDDQNADALSQNHVTVLPEPDSVPTFNRSGNSKQYR